MLTTSTYLQLKQLVHASELVVFVGGGLSSHVYHSWAELIRNLCNECDVPQPGRAKSNDPNHLMKKADKCRTANISKYREYMRKHFAPAPVYRRRAYGFLAKMPFKAFVTTNFDPMLEDELRNCRPGQLRIWPYPDLDILKMAPRDNTPVFYLHGKINSDMLESVDRLVLGLEEYELAYASQSNSGPVAGFLQQLFTHQRVLFLGCGLREPLMRRILNSCKGTRSRIGRKGEHFAFLPHERKPQGTSGNSEIDCEAEALQDNDMRECGIDILRYDEKDRFHSTVDDILQDLLIPPRGILPSVSAPMSGEEN